MDLGCIKIRLVCVTLMATVQYGYSQFENTHEKFYDYLSKDQKSVKAKLKKDKLNKGFQRDELNSDSLVISVRNKCQDQDITFFFIKDTCRYIGVRNGSTTYDELLETFRKNYAELTDRDWPEYFDDYKLDNQEPVASFEDISRHIIYFVIRHKGETQNASVFYFYSGF